MEIDAAQVAMDIGTAELMKVGSGHLDDPGYKKLKEAMRSMVFPFARAEAKQLYKSGHKSEGHIIPAAWRINGILHRTS